MSSGLRIFSEKDKDILRSTPLVDVLRELGKDVSHHNGDLFFSPFHDEKTPSFHIDRNKNQWFDHGMRNPDQKAGGDAFDLVQGVLNCSFSKACEFLSSITPTAPVEGVSVPDQKTGGTTLEVGKVRPCIVSPLLRTYATQERHIPAEVLDRYCSQVNYRFRYANGTLSPEHFAIGFPNVDGNWALRNLQKAANKISTGQNFSAVSPDGTFLTSFDLQAENCGAKAESVVVFEGFFDFMSWLAWNGAQAPTKADAVVLNSVSNDKKALDFLLSHDRIVAYLDNDEAGSLHTEFLKSKAEGRDITFTDGRSAFSQHKDLNEAWVAADRKRQAEEFRKSRERNTAAIEEESLNRGPHM